IHLDSPHPRGERFRDEREIAAVRRLRILLRMDAEGGRVRLAAANDPPRIEVTRDAFARGTQDLVVGRMLGREVEVAGEDGVRRLRRGIEGPALALARAGA